MAKIKTRGNICWYSGEETAPEATDSAKPETKPTKTRTKPEKVNLKFQRVRVQISHSNRVRVRQDGETLVILLDSETPNT